MSKIPKPEFKQKSIRTFVIRAGRITEGQRAAFEQWWPRYGLSLYDGLLSDAGYLSPGKKLVIEIGFGMGDSLFEMAKVEQDSQFIGIEVHPPGVGRLVNRAGEAGLDNLRVYMADANDVLQDCFDEKSIDRLQLFFPDPWHKKKHHKRRIVQKEFVIRVIRLLKPGGILHIATDWENYAQAIVEVLREFEELENLAGEAIYSARPAYRPQTKFEKRGESLGHRVWDLLYRRLH